MSSTHIAVSGSDSSTELSRDTQHPAVDYAHSQSPVQPDAQIDRRRQNSDGSYQSPGNSGDIDPVPEPQLTDSEAIRIAQERYGSNFTASAAREFLAYREDSTDIQACEFYRFSDEHFNKWGYF